MSLNGLDGVAVAEAHQAALAEAGGWFLLQYVNRDTVELLKKGTGGVQEVRSVIQHYEEKSPLYGLVQYRRKKVVLKYVPDGTSRLLQVRLTVQFQSVLETFTPHDTVFSFTTASELTESALGLCTMLLPSAASLTSSSSSLRRRRLDGITEDAEESAAPQEEKAPPGTAQSEPPSLPPFVRLEPLEELPTPTYGRRELDELPASAVLAKALLAKRKEEAAAAATTPNPELLSDETSHPPRKESLAVRGPSSPLPASIDKALPATPESTPPTTSEGEPPRPLDYETTNTILLESSAVDPSEPLTPRPPHIRHLSVAESDSISQWSSNVASYAAVKPKKKKLGPRPHVESGHRPKTSGTSETSVTGRPVANLPNSIRISNRSVVSLSLRPGSQHSTRSVPGRFAHSTHPINSPPPLPSPSHLGPLYKQGESRHTVSRPASVNTEATTATPEKLRLMKALQLRKRNMLLAQRSSAGTISSTSNATTSNDTESAVETHTSSINLASAQSHDQLSNIDEESKVIHSSNTTSPTFMTNISEEPSTKASSFTEPDDLSRKRRSLSSATSSSITPKATVPERIQASEMSDEDGHRGRPLSRTTREIQLGPPFEDGVAALKEPTKGQDVDHTVTNQDESQVNDTSIREPSSSPSPARTGSSPAPPAASISPTKARRVALPRPLKIASTTDTSASDASDDESLMDELQNATVHEAKPVSVARSPVTPIMSKGSSDRLREIVNKTANSTYQARRSASTTPERNRAASIRSVSTALPQWPPVLPEAVPLPLTKKPTIGSGISKRIKALEVLTTKDANAQPSLPTREPSQQRSAFSTFMKRSSFLSTQPTPNASTDKSPPKKLPEQSTYDTKFAASSKDLRQPSIDANVPIPKGDTISVTARIVRDPGNKHPPMSPSSSYATPLQLFRSPLIVEHERHDDGNQEQPLASLRSLTKSPTKSEKGRFSFSSHRSASQVNLPRSESSKNKMTQGSSYKRHGSRSASDAGSFTEEKKSSRTSRLMKRVSNLTSSRKQNQSLPEKHSHPNTIQEQTEPARQNSIAESLLHVVDIGDVNVQFPDSLLWKRRFMRVDDQGYLIFSPPMTDANMKSISRKYHLSDFKKPTLPDLEREEMAWSILLDLKDGRCIQCACESKHSRQQVLQMLVDAYSAYHQLYG